MENHNQPNQKNNSKKCQEVQKDIDGFGISMAGSETVSRFGSANAEYIKGYTGVDNETGQKMAKGLVAQHENLFVRMPFRDHGIDKPGVFELLEGSGLGLPKYYSWRSRSGCTFCFFQQKIEWVRLKENHPEAFEAAKAYEKNALEHGSPFTWSQGEPLTDLEQPQRVAEIMMDFENRKQRELARRKPNPLRVIPIEPVDIDDLYLEDEGGGACLVCHK